MMIKGKHTTLHRIPMIYMTESYVNECFSELMQPSRENVVSWWISDNSKESYIKDRVIYLFYDSFQYKNWRRQYNKNI